MTNQREAISKWLFENLRQDSNFYARDVVLTESVWQAAQADQANAITQLQADNAKMREVLTSLESMASGLIKFKIKEALGETK